MDGNFDELWLDLFDSCLHAPAFDDDALSHVLHSLFVQGLVERCLVGFGRLVARVHDMLREVAVAAQE